MMLVLSPPEHRRDWQSIGELRGHPVECVIDGRDALVRVGEWITTRGSRPIIDELRELLEASLREDGDASDSGVPGEGLEPSRRSRDTGF
jgi:hypothetical protein